VILSKTSGLINPSLRREIADVYNKQTDESTALDVGAGTINYGLTLKSLGFEVTVLERGSHLQEDATTNGLTFISSDAAEMKSRLGEERFSLVHAAHVLEHVEDPKRLLLDLITLAQPGGILHVSFPCVESILVRLKSSRWLSGFEPRHLYLPDSRVVESWLNGLEQVESVRRVGESSPVDVGRWIVGRYNLGELRGLSRKLLMGIGLIGAVGLKLFGVTERAHIFVRLR
jgi:2-polyprenyl-3-methyl-5-hydroxy-6-metoxy-1,4-benzoquinol methylase